MIYNILKMAFRRASRHKGLAFINIFGLSAAMAFCILILLFVQNELSYDNHYKSSERIYRITTDFDMAGSMKKMARTPANAGVEFMNAIPEIVSYTRVSDGPFADFVVESNKIKIDDKGLFIADPSFFNILKYDFIYGNSNEVLTNPNDIVITKSVSNKLFGDTNPIGTELKINGVSYQISAVVNDKTFKSHFNFNYLISIEPFVRGNDEIYNNWLRCPVSTYVCLTEPASVDLLPQKMQEVFRQGAAEYADKWGVKLDFDLQDISDIHLTSHLNYEFEPNGNKQNVYYLSVVGLLLLVVAIVNFINLVTAQSFKRVTEIGLRKVFGSNRRQLITEFIIESFITTLISLLISIFIVGLLLPYYNRFLDMDFSIAYLLKAPIVISMGFMWFLSAIGAGIYPAFVLSKYKPEETITGKIIQGMKRNRFMKSLVVFQFVITTILIFSTLIMQEQLSFMLNTKISFIPKQTLIIKAKTRDVIDRSVFVKHELLKNPAITQATFSYTYPGLAAQYDVACFLEGQDEKKTNLFRWQGIDFDYIDFFGLDIIKGRNFDANLSSDSTNAFILNETAVRLLNVTDDVVGKRLNNASQGTHGIVIGVIKDFHQETLKNDLVPLMYQIVPTGGTYLALKMKSNSIPETLDWIEKTWSGIDPDNKMEYFFMDDYFNQLYKEEKKMGNLFLVFSLMIIIISSLGLFGLVSFITLQKTKEIGIRRVNGSTVFEIVKMLNYIFIKWIAIAFVIAVPIAWYIMDIWLQNFAYKIEMSWWFFALAGIIVYMIALMTVSWQTYNAARRNPVEALRYE